VRTAQIRYDLIFMDHMMPDMDGIESLRGIRAIGTEYASAVPVIALTANALVGNEQRFLENGFQAFLAKPLDMWQLDAVFQRFIPDGTQTECRAPEKGDERAEKKSALLPLLQNAGIPGLNVEAALKRFAGDASAYLSVLQSWVRHMPGLLEQARAVSGETLGDYAVVIHGIKGSCLGIDATPAGRKAEKLEEAAINGDFAFIAAHNAECVETLERLLADLSALLAKGGLAEKPLKEAPDAETLARLKAACAAYDVDGVDAALEELDAYHYQNRQELVVWLHEQAQAMEFARMAEAL
jgi:CheY-like chemotaxis protein